MLPAAGTVVWVTTGTRPWRALVIGRVWPALYSDDPPVLLVLEQRPDGCYHPGILRVPIANVIETEAAIAAGRSS